MLDELQVREALAIAHEMAEQEFRLLGAGSYRHTYDVGGNLVLKIPISPWCIRHNRTEAEARAEFPHLPLADCVLVEYCGVEALLMEKVRPRSDWPAWNGVRYPDWYSIDGEQFGITADGRVVAYDYGLAEDVEHIAYVCELTVRNGADGE